MEDINKDKKILVVGLGKSGLAACRVLLEKDACIYVQDMTPLDQLTDEKKAFIKENKIPHYLGAVPEDVETFDMLVLSPGVSPKVDFVQQAAAAGAVITGELELAYQLGKGKYLAITGTNGKTTTTSLIGEIYHQAALAHFVVGNIGVAVLDKAMEATEDTWMITEISSFQLETIHDFQPQVSVILNITPDHLNRHGSMAAYKGAKTRVFENQVESQYVVMNFDDKESFSMASQAKGIIVPFSRVEELLFGAFVKNECIVIRNHQEETIEICPVNQLKILGEHNLENALAAAAACYFAGVDKEAIAKGLMTFKGVEHRIEDCGTVDGVRYYNDSKGTNPEAAIKAVDAMDGPVILIAGGYDKGAEYDDLVAHFENKVKKVILMGATATKIKLAAEKMGYSDTIIMKDMDSCVKEASRIADNGDIILLSPACASWDMYDNFEQRGQHFKGCVEKLRK